MNSLDLKCTSFTKRAGGFIFFVFKKQWMGLHLKHTNIGNEKIDGLSALRQDCQLKGKKFFYVEHTTIGTAIF